MAEVYTMAKKVNPFDALRKKKAEMEAYYEKIRKMEEQQKALEDNLALKVGQLILKKLNSDIDSVETFSEWLELYLLEQEENVSESQSEASDEPSDVTPYGNQRGVNK